MLNYLARSRFPRAMIAVFELRSSLKLDSVLGPPALRDARGPIKNKPVLFLIAPYLVVSMCHVSISAAHFNSYLIALACFVCLVSRCVNCHRFNLLSRAFFVLCSSSPLALALGSLWASSRRTLVFVLFLQVLL